MAGKGRLKGRGGAEAGVPVGAGVLVMGLRHSGGKVGCVAEKFWKRRRGIRDAVGEECLENVTFTSGPEEQGVHNQGQVFQTRIRVFSQRLLSTYFVPGTGLGPGVWAGADLSPLWCVLQWGSQRRGHRNDHHVSSWAQSH